MRKGRFVRVVGISVLLLASAVVSAGAAPRASSTFASSASVGVMNGAAWGGRHMPSFKGACGAMVTAGMGQTFACHKRFYDIYHARSGVPPKWRRVLLWPKVESVL